MGAGMGGNFGNTKGSFKRSHQIKIVVYMANRDRLKEPGTKRLISALMDVQQKKYTTLTMVILSITLIRMNIIFTGMNMVTLYLKENKKEIFEDKI